MPRVALITDRLRPDGIGDDVPFIRALSDRRITTQSIAWDAPADWSGIDAAVVRTPWNYFHDLPGFLRFIDSAPVPVWNPPAVIAWNADKRYLTMFGPDVPVPYWMLVEKHVNLDLAFGWHWRYGEAVIKPTVSGGGHDTWRVPAEGPFPALTAREYLVQQFLPEIESEGELSLVYIDGVFAHAVRKRPRGGSFLVQEEHGGRTTPETPDADALQAGDRVVADVTARFGEAPLYARVDLVRHEGRDLLMELELIEPELYFRFGAESAERLAEAVVGRLKGG